MMKIVKLLIENIMSMYFVSGHNHAKIAKQCEHCKKLELIYYFYHTRFCA